MFRQKFLNPLAKVFKPIVVSSPLGSGGAYENAGELGQRGGETGQRGGETGQRRGGDRPEGGGDRPETGGRQASLATDAGTHARPLEPQLKVNFQDLSTFGDKCHKMAPRTT